MPHRVGAAMAVACAAALLLTGCAAAPEPTPTVVTPRPTPTPVFAVAAGDCLGALDLAAADALRQISPTPCKTAHAWQVASIVPLNDPQYPGSEALKTKATKECAKAFKKFIGVDVAYSRYSSAYLAPDGKAWSLPDDHQIVCLAGDPDGGLKKSIKGDSSVFPAVGQCTGPQNVPPVDVRIIACTKKHNYEVYAEQKIDSPEAPTADEVNKLVDDVCVAGFEKFIGLTTTKSMYEYTWFVAGADLWKKLADHRIVCSVGLAAGGITGSLANANK